MLTKINSELYLEVITKEPAETFFYHDRPVLYSANHNGKNYIVALADEDNEKQTETFIIVDYAPLNYTLLQSSLLTPREFFNHPDNTVHHAVIEYTETGPVILSGEPYEDNSTIPDEYLPSTEARWK